MNENRKDIVKESISELIEMFKSKNIPQAIALATHPKLNVPSNKWSLANRIIQFLHATSDSRGFRQWKESGRFVKRDSKAFYIFAPKTHKTYQCICEKQLSKHEIENGICDKCNEKIVKEDVKIFISFIPVAVFRAEDTEGEPLDYEQINLPQHKFMDVAKSWNLEIKAIAFQKNEYGYYRKEKEICLASPEEIVFYHELAHAAHDRLHLLKKSSTGKAANEIVAEFAAIVLCYMDNKSTELIGGAYEYLQGYARVENKSVETAVMKLLSEIESVLKLILDTESALKNKNDNALPIAITENANAIT